MYNPTSFVRRVPRRRGQHRRLRTILALAVSALLLGLFPVVALADMGPPVKIVIVPQPDGIYPVQGQFYEGSFDIMSGANAVVGSFDLRPVRGSTGAEDWQLLNSSLPEGAQVPVSANVPLTVTYEALIGDPTEVVTFEFVYNGKPYRQDIRLAPRQSGLARIPSGATAVPVDPRDEPGLQSPDESAPRPAPIDADEIGPDPSETRPEPAEREGQEPEKLSDLERTEDAPSDDLAKSYTMRVTGRFIYYRSDGRKMGADGLTVRVMDEDWEWDDQLAAQVTDANGYFDISFTYTQSEDPDVYLEFEASNSEVTIEDSDVWETNYSWRTSVRDDFSGTTIHYGELKPNDTGQYPALHILTHITRTWRFFAERGWNPDNVDVLWPDGQTGAYYNPFWEEIHVSTERQWREDTLAHEYAHHWMEENGENAGSDYCNSPARCDSGDDCGHCMWCEETAGDAMQEGFPNWIADAFTRSYTSKYGYDPLNFRDLESISQCNDVSPAEWDDPWTTEGYIGSLLTDLDDGNQDDDPGAGLGMDELNMTTTQIMAVVDNFEPTTPNGFIIAFNATYPELRTAFWATAANNRLNQADNTPPGAITNLTSTSHTVNVSSPDRTIEFTWTAPSDDFSGIGGYSALLSNSIIDPGSSTTSFGAVTSFTSGTLAAGTYYLTMRARDRAGNWASGYQTAGPFVIRDPYPADINPVTPAGWGDEIVARPAADASGSSVPLPTTLPGESTGTYWNVAFRNDGELATNNNWLQHISLDGNLFATRTIPSGLGPGAVYAWWNQGPITVRGGRHTLSVAVDANETHSEQNEASNDYARQYVWTPLTMLAPQEYFRTAPPRSTAGWASGSLVFSVNADGLRFSQTGGIYSIVSMRATDDAVDYDLRMHPVAASATSGFSAFSVVASSRRPAGCLDAVLLREGTASAMTFDVGVVNYAGGTEPYKIIKENSSTIPWASDTNVDFAAEKFLLIRQFDAPFSQTVTFTIDHDPSAGPLQVAWFDQNFAEGDLLDYDAYAKTDAQGHATIIRPVVTGTQGLVIWRDPRDVIGSPAPAVTAVVRVSTTPADIKPTVPPGWWAALVPRPANDGTYNSVPLPTSLSGDTDSTYLNTALQNAGPNSTPYTWTRFYVDGVQSQSSYFGPIPPNSVQTYNQSFPITVRGGRHTLSVHFDADQTAPEMSDANNDYGRQFVWTPATLIPSTVTTRTAPPDPLGGWDDILAGGQAISSYNADGLRMPAPVPLGEVAWWRALATMPGPNSDVDPRLHEVENGVLSGFLSPKAQSGWGPGQSDFVLANFRATTPPRPFDVGILGREGNESYTAQVVSSTYIGKYPSGSFGPFAIESGKILDLHEVELEAGPVAIGLTELAGDVDWGISLHRGDLAYQAKSLTVDEGVRWLQPRGWDEWLVIDVPVTGRYCLAVWKVGHADLAREGQYQLIFGNEVTSTDDVSPGPTRTALQSVQPNPFNPRTVVRFDLGEPGAIELAIFNIRGERVRTLVRESRTAGRHEVAWDGLDDRGTQVSSGVYLVQLNTASGVDQRKAVLLK